MRRVSYLLVFCVAVLLGTNVTAQEIVAPEAASEAAETPTATEASEAGSNSENATEDGESLGLNIDLGYASAYVFRGLNVFQQDGQMNQNMMVAPALSWSIFDTGLTVGYWGAFQITGDFISENIDGALGAEQDLYVTYDLALPSDMGLSFGLTYYLYPGSDETIAGTTLASYIEPRVSFSASTLVDLGLNVAYFFGIQDVPGVRGISYLYLNPTVSKSLELSPMFGLDLGLGYGFKLFNEGNDGAANVHDGLASVAVPIQVTNMFSVTPGLNVALTNIPELDIADELAFWGGLNLGLSL